MFRLGSWSLVKKLMFLYSLSTVGILFAVSLFLYPSFNKAFHHKEEVTVLYSAQKPVKEKVLKESNDITIECFKKSILALLLSVLGALGLGYIVARNGLKRIDEFTALMAKISGLSLEERVNPRDWPKELKNLGKTFNSMLDRIQASFVQLNQFSSDLAHEIRTPIHNLQGLTEVALTQKSPVEYRQILESHLEEFQYLSRLVENLLFIARSSNKQIVISKEKLDLKNEISKICDFYSALAEESNIALTCQGEGFILADPLLFKRVINNLLSNAFRHTSPGGRITFEVKQQADGFVVLTLQDTGVGIPYEHINKLFDRFYRVDFARASHLGGLGLGLTIVKSIMDLHQGSITLQSEEGQGTYVKLVFPATDCYLK